MSIKIDQEKCIGCGTCEAICSSHFKINDNGKAEVTSQDEAECVKEAVESCAVDAIIVD
ncbi:ferredoxin [Patescibacteria group bacterium]|nr:ferredoxin [Patescibacteria group bacterium]MBU4512261.1 ferredoxin [Patescibacteria group bacterium]